MVYSTDTMETSNLEDLSELIDNITCIINKNENNESTNNNSMKQASNECNDDDRYDDGSVSSIIKKNSLPQDKIKYRVSTPLWKRQKLYHDYIESPKTKCITSNITPSICTPMQHSVVQASIATLKRRVESILNQSFDHYNIREYVDANVKSIECHIKNTLNVYCIVSGYTMFTIIGILESMNAIRFKHACKGGQERHYSVNYVFKAKLRNSQFKIALMTQMNLIKRRYVAYRLAWGSRFNSCKIENAFEKDLYYIIKIMEST